MKNLIESANSFLFALVNMRYVRIFSVLTAFMLVLDFYPIEPYDQFHNFSWLAPWQGLAITPAYRGILLLLIICFTIGWRGRVTGLSLAALLFPLIFVAYTPTSRQVLVIVLICLALLHGGISSAPLPIWPLRLIQLQLSIVYGVNALAKASPPYLNGDILIAMSMTLHNFLTNLSDGFYHIGPWALPAALAAQASVVIEGALAVGFWFPSLRLLTAVIGILFHFQLKTIVRIGMLDWTCMFLYLTFLLPFTKPRGE